MAKMMTINGCEKRENVSVCFVCVVGDAVF